MSYILTLLTIFQIFFLKAFPYFDKPSHRHRILLLLYNLLVQEVDRPLSTLFLVAEAYTPESFGTRLILPI